MVYYAAFERGRLEELQEALPHLEAPLGEVIDHLVDLLPMVRDHVYHPDFGGGFSIKKVLPALVPELSYDGLAVADGQRAMIQLERLLLREDGRRARRCAGTCSATARWTPGPWSSWLSGSRGFDSALPSLFIGLTHSANH